MVPKNKAAKLRTEDTRPFEDVAEEAWLSWHVAEAFRLRCAVASPCLIPYEHAASLEAQFGRSHPALFAELRASAALSWADVAHWMWPLFHEDRWARWRRERLKLAWPPLSDQPLPSVVQPVQLSEVLVHTRATKAGRGARRSPASRAPYIHTWAKKQNSTDYVVCRERRLDLA